MPSLVIELQQTALNTSKSVADLLRMVKLIAVKLNLPEIKEWVEHELNGYHTVKEIPEYRYFSADSLYVRNPIRGWTHAGHIQLRLPCLQPVSEIEELAKSESVVLPLSESGKFNVSSQLGRDINNWPQQVSISPVQLVGVLDAIRNKVVDWSGELEQRGIKGENMSFNETERQSAHQNITIQNFTGVLGSVSNSQITIYDYSTIHQALKNNSVPQNERNEIEDIMDGLKKAKEDEKPNLLGRAKAWIAKNKDFLGATADVVRRACGLPTGE